MIGRKVEGSGPLPSKVLLCGEGPGQVEASTGRPFSGYSGSDLDWVFLKRAAGLHRDEIYATNVVKWRTDEDDRDPTPEEIERDRDELESEVLVCNPQTIVAVGRVAAEWFMGRPVSMEKYHGIPIECPRYPGRTLLVAYHPADGLHQPERYYHLAYWDFQQLGGVVRGEIRRHQVRLAPQIISTSPQDVPLFSYAALDTEGSDTAPWGMSIAGLESVGYVVRHGTCALPRRVVGHNILHDVKVFRALGKEIDLRHCDDSMLLAYLFPWLPRALKPLMFKLCGMEQREYEEVIGPAEETITNDYLQQVLNNQCDHCNGEGLIQKYSVKDPTRPLKSRESCSHCSGDGTRWPKPSPQLVFDHSGVGKRYKPHSVGRRVRSLLKRGTGLREGWTQIDDQLRAPVEAKLGRMREATLDDIHYSDAVQYAGVDACGTMAVANILKPMLKQYGLERVYEIDKGILPIIDRMHTNGILIDTDYFRRLDEEFKAEQEEVLDATFEAAGHSFNPGSPIAVSNLLYGRLALRNRGGNSTDEKTLESLKIRYRDRPEVVRVIDGITDYRELDKLRGTYVQPLPTRADTFGRVHTRFLLHVTSSGRLSSRDPNLQNIPTRTERGRKIRAGFIARPGCSLVSVDLDQIELRVAAHLSEDPNMIEVFRSGKDIHRATAALIYKKPMGEITAQERLLCKSINFGVLYGMSAKRLHKELNLLGIEVTLDECIQFIAEWFAAYPGIRDYMDRCHSQAREMGYVECLFGRRRYLWGVHSTIDRVREESLRWSVNHPDQGTAAAILKIWMRRVWDLLPTVARYGFVEPLLTVHDELIFEAEKGIEDLLISLVVSEAQAAVDLLVPVAAKGGYGHTWSDLK